MSSDESPSRGRVTIAGAFGTAIREFITVVYKEDQIVGYYDHGNDPKHFTKHGDGILHAKSDIDHSTLWERLGQPLADMTGSECLGTYSYHVGDKDELRPLNPRKGDKLMILPAHEGMSIDVVVFATPKSPPGEVVEAVYGHMLYEGLSVFSDLSNRFIMGVRERKETQSSQ
jgi:hypothetical protein